MSRIREGVAYAVALLSIGVAGLTLAVSRGLDAQSAAAWVQAVGSVAAIFIVTLPVILQNRMEIRRARVSTLANAETAYATMGATATLCLNTPDSLPEWWVPQWDVIAEALATSPIQSVDSPEAARAFIALRESCQRVSGIDPSDDSTYAPGLVVYLMNDAATQIETLRRALRA